jgi:hypothetical protein
VVAVTDGRLDFGTWERIFQGQVEWLTRESRRPAAEAGARQDHRGVAAITAILTSTDAGAVRDNDICIHLRATAAAG